MFLVTELRDYSAGRSKHVAMGEIPRFECIKFFFPSFVTLDGFRCELDSLRHLDLPVNDDNFNLSMY